MLTRHSLEFLGLRDRHGVEFLVVGAYAAGLHGFPRYPGDRDAFVAINPENADRRIAVFAEFGFASLGLTPADFLEPDVVAEIGQEPTKIQVLTGIDGVSFEQCRRDRVVIDLDGLRVPFIGFDSLLAHKAASPRAKDRIALEELPRVREQQPPPS